MFKTKWFVPFARRSRIDDAMLREAIQRAERGLIDADLGGGIIKQRVARPNEGALRRLSHNCRVSKSGEDSFSLRVRQDERDNIKADELESLREIGAALILADEKTLANALAEERLQEVNYDEAE